MHGQDIRLAAGRAFVSFVTKLSVNSCLTISIKRYKNVTVLFTFFAIAWDVPLLYDPVGLSTSLTAFHASGFEYL